MFGFTLGHIKESLVLAILIFSLIPVQCLSQGVHSQVELTRTHLDLSENALKSSGSFAIYDTASAKLKVDQPSLVEIKITGDVFLKLQQGYFLVPELEIKREDAGLRPRAIERNRQREGDNRYIEAVFLMQPGMHSLTLKADINGWTSSTDFARERYELEIQITRVALVDHPAWMTLFNEWVATVGLREEVGIVAAVAGPSFDGYAGYFSGIPNVITEMEMQTNPNVDHWNTNLSERRALLEEGGFFDDSLFIVFSNTLSRAKLRSLESDFYKAHGVTLWDKFFRKASLLSDKPPGRIFANVNVSCSGSQVMRVSPGVVVRFGGECTSATAAQTAPDWIADRVSSAATVDAVANAEGFARIIEGYLDSEVNALGGRVRYLERGDAYIEAIIDGVRGWVIDGGQEWERVQISFALIGSENKKVRIFVDGMLASGLGSAPPPASKYTYSMEPDYAALLSNHARATLDKLLNSVQ